MIPTHVVFAQESGSGFHLVHPFELCYSFPHYPCGIVKYLSVWF